MWQNPHYDKTQKPICGKTQKLKLWPSWIMKKINVWRRENLQGSFKKNIPTPWQPMRSSLSSVLRFSRCFTGDPVRTKLKPWIWTKIHKAGWSWAQSNPWALLGANSDNVMNLNRVPIVVHQHVPFSLFVSIRINININMRYYEEKTLFSRSVS